MNTEQRRAYHREYAKKNPDKIKKWRKNYSIKYREEIIENSRKNYQKTKEYRKRYSTMKWFGIKEEDLEGTTLEELVKKKSQEKRVQRLMAVIERKNKDPAVTKCLVCPKEFKTRRNKWFCSHRCRERAHYPDKMLAGMRLTFLNPIFAARDLGMISQCVRKNTWVIVPENHKRKEEKLTRSEYQLKLMKKVLAKVP